MARPLWILGVVVGLAGAVPSLPRADAASPAAAAETNPSAPILRLSRNIPGDSKPIVLHADEIITWLEGNRRAVLLRGMVMVEHGIVTTRMERGVAWIDQDLTRRSGVMRVDLYAEGSVVLESGAQVQQGAKAILDLHTRGELKLRSKNKVEQKAAGDDDFYQRAEREIAAGRASGNRAVPGGFPEADGVRPAGLIEAGVAPPPSFLPESAPPAPQPVPPRPPAMERAGTVSDPLPSRDRQGAERVPADLPVQPGVMPTLPVPTPVPGGPPPIRNFSIVPRTSAPFQAQRVTLPSGEQVMVVTGGVILNVRTADRDELLDIEADQLVLWTRGDLQNVFEGFRGSDGRSAREVEFYLAGNVEIREMRSGSTRTLRAAEVYYDVNRNVAVARDADLQFRQPGLPDDVHLKADELLQMSPTMFQAIRAEVFSSRLPSDPGLKIVVAEATLEERQIPKRSLFGRPAVNPVTGQPETVSQRYFRSRDVVFKAANVPFFYLPYLQGDADRPFGPLEDVRVKYDRIFGGQLYTTFDAYSLFGIDPVPATRWRFNADYLTRRGPALGTDFNYAGRDLIFPGTHRGHFKAWGIYDDAPDILGGPRGPGEHHTPWRGRLLGRHAQELPLDFSLQLQASVLSDKNFLEQYYKDEFDRDLNQETFAFLKQQRDNWAWTALVKPRIRGWVTETEWLPRADGYLLGQSFFDLFTYNVHGSAGYAQLRPAGIAPPPLLATDARTDTARFDLWQELSLPITLGAFRVVPYGIIDLTHYTTDLTGTDRSRFYGAGGVRASTQFSRIFPDIQSELWNVNGIHHKIVPSINYYAAHSDTPFGRLPQLDRIHDDATDQALRDIRPLQPTINPKHGLLLATSPLYDPQLYALRRLVDNRIDTLDSIDVLQVDIRQRWQTKRGFPGNQHIIDWMTLELSGSIFPHSNRDNFGETLAFLQYDWTWNVGDRTALVSSGWLDPIDNGARVFTIGSFLNRPDRTSVYVGYRHIDPLESRAVTAALGYVFSTKYAMSASSTYDFGTNQSLSNSLVFTRTGTDLQLSLGINYNAMLNNFGFTFELYPNIAPQTRRVAALPAFGSGMFGR